MHPFIQQYRYPLLGGGLLLATSIGVGIYLHRRKKKKQRPVVATAPGTLARSTPPASSGFCKSYSYPLGHGNCHPDVKTLQAALLALGADLGGYGPKRDGVDGKFGDKTLAALRAKTGKSSVTSGDMQRLQALLKSYGG